MTHIDTAFDRTFSEPPAVTVAENRTHCEACQEPLHPDVMHKCAGNEEWKLPVLTSPVELTTRLVDPEPLLIDGRLVDPARPHCSVAPLQGLDAPLTEQQKYQLMWARDEYRRVVPGAQIAPEFLNIARPKAGSTVIDFGCGTGEGALMIALLGGIRVEMLDFAANCLDEDVRSALTTQAHALSFRQHDLTQQVPLAAEHGFCTDVMEHIPPEQVDLVLTNILQAARHVFFQISCVDDSCGKLIGHALHLSVHEPAWWKKKLEDLGCTIHYWHDAGESCVAYVTAWSDGQDIVDVGQLNIAEETIRQNVRTNLKAGWHQVMPHAPQSTEVMILGGGPSLAGQLDTIRRMRFEGVKLVTLNGAYNWAIEHGLEVSAQIVVDARPHNARFTKPVQSQTIYLMGSQVDPSVLEGLPKERTLLWHTTAESIRDILEEECPGKWFGVPGGSTVLLRAIPLLRMLGYSRFHLFG